MMGAIVAAPLNVSMTNPQAAAQFVRSFQHALLSAAGITFAAAVIAVTTVRKNHPTDEAKALDAADR